MTDPLLRLLADLPEAQPDRARSERVRKRCHAVLARRRAGSVRRRAARIGETVLSGLCALYLIETVRQALVLAGLV